VPVVPVKRLWLYCAVQVVVSSTAINGENGWMKPLSTSFNSAKLQM